jgi:hypothetical protein
MFLAAPVAKDGVNRWKGLVRKRALPIGRALCLSGKKTYVSKPFQGKHARVSRKNQANATGYDVLYNHLRIMP